MVLDFQAISDPSCNPQLWASGGWLCLQSWGCLRVWESRRMGQRSCPNPMFTTNWQGDLGRVTSLLEPSSPFINRGNWKHPFDLVLRIMKRILCPTVFPQANVGPYVISLVLLKQQNKTVSICPSQKTWTPKRLYLHVFACAWHIVGAQ